MKIKTYGYQNCIWESLGKGYFGFVNKKMTESQTDKKLKATYFIRARWKNHSKKHSTSNNESLILEFDTNLSSDFVFQQVDYKTGKSITISLVKSTQTDFSTTKLELSIQYINEQQELFENQSFHYCDTVPGTIAKRLQVYKAAFDKAVEEEIARIDKDGFQIHQRHLINNFAGYLYFENQRRAKSQRFLSEISPKADINKTLILFSMFNDDCFFGSCQNLPSWTTIHNFPYSDLGEYNKLKQAFLFGEQVAELERMIAILKTLPFRLFENFDYSRIKNEVLFSTDSL